MDNTGNSAQGATSVGGATSRYFSRDSDQVPRSWIVGRDAVALPPARQTKSQQQLTTLPPTLPGTGHYRHHVRDRHSCTVPPSTAALKQLAATPA
ncbi:MAG TPA: hypothetical protein VFA63_14800, partial [Pseudonocardiaceae bacterium]|nr:hypothetical protein [Pseudonocardiaceae bacterium]